MKKYHEKKTNIPSTLVAEAVGALSLVCSCLLSLSSLLSSLLPLSSLVETICAPCGIVNSWAKFAKSESPTNILNFLESVYPTEESWPDYICIDKACLVLWTVVANHKWRMWKKFTCFIVDGYHYINHHTTDYMCRKWCDPAPLNGSAVTIFSCTISFSHLFLLFLEHSLVMTHFFSHDIINWLILVYYTLFHAAHL